MLCVRWSPVCLFCVCSAYIGVSLCVFWCACVVHHDPYVISQWVVCALLWYVCVFLMSVLCHMVAQMMCVELWLCCVFFVVCICVFCMY